MRNRKKPIKKKQNILPILCGVLALVAVVMIVALCIPKTPDKGEFTPPAFETAAVKGTPTVDEKLAYQEVYADGMAYRLSVCCVPALEDNALTVYFTSPESNEKHLKLRVLDGKGNILGETGLIRPGEYVQTVTLDQRIAPGTKVALKVMGYEPETYESAGSITINVTIAGTPPRRLWIVGAVAVAAVLVACYLFHRKRKSR